MLSKIKDSLNKKLIGLGAFIGKFVPPNILTLIGLLLGISSALVYSNLQPINIALSLDIYKSSLFGGLLLLSSGIIDGLDGLVARTAKKVSNRGSFLDSISDRIVDGLIFLALGFGGYIEWWLAFSVALVSQWISYVRAKGESLGLKMAGIGLIERQERIIAIIILSILFYYLKDIKIFNYGAIILLILSIITLINRIAYIIKNIN